jgi:6-phosphogluconolactonase
MTAAANQALMMYVGTYTRREAHVVGKSQGIQIFRFNPATGEMRAVGELAGLENPTFLAIHPSKQYLYAVSELTERVEGRPAGAIAALKIDPATGDLTLLNKQASLGTSPCHLQVDATGGFVLASNYGSGGVCVLPIRADGSLGTTSDFVEHTGSSVNPQRQKEPHPHSVNLLANNEFAFVPDLGTDKVMIYHFDAEQGKLHANPEQPWARTKSGAGPRHMAFHPNGRFAYVANELDSTVAGFALDADKGTLREINTVSALPPDFTGTSWCADIHVHPLGHTVYVSNRGHDSIGVLRVDQESGEVTPIDYTSTGGEVPRNFALDPSGRFLLAANQNTDSIVVFEMDARTGKLTPTGQTAQTPTPVCIKFLAL